MKTEYKQYIITTPDNFQKVPLPGFQAWYDALMKNPPQGKGQLCKVEKGIRKYCCLGVLCETQGRLNKKDVFFYDGNESADELSTDNPLRLILGELGKFPVDCNVHLTNSPNLYGSFATINDSLGMTMIDIAEVLNTFFCEP